MGPVPLVNNGSIAKRLSSNVFSRGSSLLWGFPIQPGTRSGRTPLVLEPLTNKDYHQSQRLALGSTRVMPHDLGASALVAATVCRKAVEMKQAMIGVVTCFVLMAVTHRAPAEITAYIDEAEYLGAIGSLGYSTMAEGFEDDTAWGGVRGGTTAASVTSQGITWTANNVNGGVTTGSGPAQTGEWGFYTLPHGDFGNGIGDGWIGNSSQTLYGVGGWLQTNTPFAAVGLLVDGVAVDFGETCVGNNCSDNDILGTQPKFFGVISTAGFTTFNYNETEGTIGDQKFIFSDDYTFAVPEPTSLSLLLISLVCLLAYRRNRRA